MSPSPDRKLNTDTNKCGVYCDECKKPVLENEETSENEREQDCAFCFGILLGFGMIIQMLGSIGCNC